MEKFELINEFIEGNLNEVQETELFASLSSDSSLRTQMKQLLSINSTMNLNRNKISIDKSLKAGIFSQIGLTVSSGIIPPAIAPISFFARNKTLISSLTSSVASVGAVLLFLFWNGSFDNGNTQIITKIEKAPSSNISSKLTANTNHSEPVIIYRDTEPVIKYIYRDVVKEDNKSFSSNNSAQEDNNMATLPLLSSSSNLFSSASAFANQAVQSISNPFSLNNSFVSKAIDYLDNEDNSKFSLEWKGNMDWNQPQETVNAASYSKLTNNALALLYNYNDRISIGADLRQESYFQSFNYINEQNDQVNIKQLPQFTTYSGFLRYKFYNTDLFKNFGQLSVGGNEIGPVYRGMLGTEFTPYSKIGLVFGLEYSSMQYKYDAKSFMSNKISLNFGIKYNF